MGDAAPCPSCGGAVAAHSGPGRPSVYCGEPCRRLAEFSIRGLVRRIDRAEIELRELRARCGGDYAYFDADDRRSRMRVLRRWLAEDQGRLRSLLGAKAAPAVEKNRTPARKSNAPDFDPSGRGGS